MLTGVPARPLFVQGVARSGTTALGRLVEAHPEVVLGIERYKARWRDLATASPALLERERYFDFRDGDTNILPAADPRWAQHYERQAAKWDRARWIGDKMVMVRVGALAKGFPGARFLVIVRPLEQVVASWQARADNQADLGWPASMDATRGVRAWAQNMRRTVEAARRFPDDVLVVDYDALGDPSGAQVRRMLAHLELDPAPEVDEAAAAIRARYDQVVARPRALDPAVRELVDQEVDPALWPALQELSAAGER